MALNILIEADNIVNKRSEEKERQYGPFNESMRKAAVIASELCNKEITTEDIFKCMIALKLSRIAFSDKEDSFTDAAAYLAALNNYKNGSDKKSSAKKSRSEKNKTRTTTSGKKTKPGGDR